MGARFPAFPIALAAVLTLSPAVFAFPEPSRARLGEKIPNLTFKDDKGKTHRLYEVNMRAMAIVFLSFECPVSNSYAQPLSEIAKQFDKFGVVVWGLTSNEDDTPAQVAKSAKDFNLAFPVFKDERLRAAKALDADFMPEVFVLDAEFVLRYRGRIDDMYSERLKKHDKVKEHNLKQALTELVTERPVSIPATRAVGCKIWREERPIAKEGKTTYHRDVAPILRQKCQECHRPGQAGPFSLLTFKQAVNWSQDIKDYTKRREMPPWKVSDGVAFHDERRLSDQEIKALADWVDGGTPLGDPKDAPAHPPFAEAGWRLGTPDLILTSDGDFILGPAGDDLVRSFVLPTSLKQDQYLAAVELRPGNPQVVQHLLLVIDTTGSGRRLQHDAQENDQKYPPLDMHTGKPSNYDRGPGYTRTMPLGATPSALYGWTAGNPPRFLPDGVGMLLPKNADLIVQARYHRNGRGERDRPKVGLYFAKKKVERPYQFGNIRGGSGTGMTRFAFSIPAGEPRFQLDGDVLATHDFTLHALMPHMHLLGKTIAVTMTPRGGTEQKLLTIKDWDFAWEEMYFLKEPIQVKAGARIRVMAHFDNSDKNPHNPFSPPRRVTAGDEPGNELCVVFLGGYSDTGEAGLPLKHLSPKR